MMARTSTTHLPVTIAVLVLAACASREPASPPPPLTLSPQLQAVAPPGERLRAALGTVGIVSRRVTPDQEVSRPIRNESVGRAAVKGAGQAALGVVLAPFQGGGGSSEGAVLWLLALPVLVPVGAIVGAGVGAARESATNAANTIPENVVREMETTLHQVLAEGDLQVNLRQKVLARTAAREARLLDVELRGEPDVMATSDYASLARKGFDTVLEVGVSNIGLIGRGGTDPELTLLMDANVRLIGVTDGRVLWMQEHMVFTTAPHRFSLWGASNGALIRSAVTEGLDALARGIEEKVFLEVWDNSGAE